MKEIGKGLSGYLLVFTGVALFATVEIAVRDSNIRLENPVPPMTLTALRFLISGVLFASFSCFRPHAQHRIPDKNDFGLMILLGVIGVPAAIGLFQFALTFEAMKASTCAAIFSINPIFVAVLAPLVLKEPVGTKDWLGLVFGFSGAAVMSYSFSSAHAETADMLWAGGSMLAAAFLFGLYVVMSKTMVRKYGVSVYTGWAFLFGGTAAAILSLSIEGIPSPDLLHLSRGTVDILWVVLGGTALAYYCYLAGLSRVHIAKGSYLFFLKPFLALLFSYLYLDERVFVWNEWIGFSMIGAGLAIVMFIPEVVFKRSD